MSLAIGIDIGGTKVAGGVVGTAAGGVGTRFLGAQQMFASLKEKFLTLPDHVQVFPGHGAGSACGKALGAIPSTTVGYERLYA